MMEYEHKIGWLDPTGTMIECGHSDHIATARTLVDLYHYQNPDHLPEDDVLLKHGWVHVTMSLLGNREWCIWWENRLTDYQKNYLRPYFEESEIQPFFGSLCKWESEM